MLQKSEGDFYLTGALSGMELLSILYVTLVYLSDIASLNKNKNVWLGIKLKVKTFCS